ncbi:diphthine--ammonia ligase [Candidatus Pacearchaeota archaeon]|nr:diphthine--ammonia ligase [Candidatus Pacearchaeota archaeon]
MKLGVLFSGGKDSALAAWLAKKDGYEISCLITIDSKNKESFMFHTPSISRVKEQAEKMDLPLIVVETEGEKEKELEDLERAILEAMKKYKIEGVVTGAVESVYQATRVQKICNKLNIECFNPLWQRGQFDILQTLIDEKFEIIVVGVMAYPLDENFLGRKIDKKFIEEMEVLWNKYKINPAGEGGEFESFTINCPLFKSGLKVKSFEDFGEGHSWRRELNLKNGK